MEGDRLLNTYAAVQDRLLAQLRLAGASASHHGTAGGIRESGWCGVFRDYLPLRYQVGGAIVIDRAGAASDQIDIVIYDGHYTPALVTQGDAKYVPAEAVYAVLECKPDITKAHLEYAADKAASVRHLQRTFTDFAHAGGSYPAREPHPILAGIVATSVGWADGLGSAFEGVLGTLDGDRRLDCGCALEAGAFDLFEPGVLTRAGSCHALVFFLFRLLRRLQTMGTVPAIDWDAYADKIGHDRTLVQGSGRVLPGASVES